jgi:copper chaperone CopZ
MKTTLIIKGTHCNACKVLIEEVCSEAPGVTNCTVDFATGVTDIEHDESVDWEKLKKEIEGLGEYKILIQ